MDGPYRVIITEDGLMAVVKGPGVHKHYFNNEEDVARATDFADMLNDVFLEGYSEGYADGKERYL